MTDRKREDTEDLEALTWEALHAAAAGRWDLVTSFYCRRAKQLEQGIVASGVAERLIEMDRAVHERASLSRAAVQGALGELAPARSELTRLKRRIAVTRDDRGRFDRVA